MRSWNLIIISAIVFLIIGCGNNESQSAHSGTTFADEYCKGMTDAQCQKKQQDISDMSTAVNNLK